MNDVECKKTRSLKMFTFLLFLSLCAGRYKSVRAHLDDDDKMKGTRFLIVAQRVFSCFPLNEISPK